MDWLLNPIRDGILAGAEWFLSGLLNIINSDILERNVIVWIFQIINYFVGFAILIGLALVLIGIFLKDNPNIRVELTDMFSGIIFALVFAEASKLMYKAGGILARMLISIFTALGKIEGVGFTTSAFLPNAAEGILIKGFMGILFALLIFILVIILFLQGFLRVGSFITIIVIGVLSIPSIMKGSKESLASYVKQIIGISVTQALQIMFIYSALVILGFGNVDVIDWSIGISLLMISTRVDKYLKDWSYTSGAKSALGGIGRTGMQLYQMSRMSKLATAKG